MSVIVERRRVLAVLAIAFSVIYTAPALADQRQYNRALEKSEKEAIDTTNPETELVIRKGFDQFKDFYSDFTVEKIKRDLNKLYSRDTYFRDGLKEAVGLQEMEAYFLKVGTLHSCRYKFVDTARSGKNFYARAIMSFQRLETDPVKEMVGMTHLMFSQEGNVIFEQDYWDTAEFLEEFPIIGRLMKWIKNQF